MAFIKVLVWIFVITIHCRYVDGFVARKPSVVSSSISSVVSSSSVSLSPFGNVSKKNNQHFGIIKSSSSKLFSSSSSSSPSSLPNEDDLKRQKSEAVVSLSDYHDGTWQCVNGATSFSISSDVAAGIIRKSKSMPYQTSVNVRLSSANLKMAETFSWQKSSSNNNNYNNNDDNNGDDDSWTALTRSVPLGSSIDIDSVDASYSVDQALMDLPHAISGTDALIKFGIEHVLAVQDDQRVRSFCLYGMDDRLVRVVIANEIRKTTTTVEKVEPPLIKLVQDQDEEMSNSIEQLFSNTKSTKQPLTQMQQLQDKIAANNNNIINRDDQQTAMERYTITMFGLSLGPWLGDSVIRDRSLYSSNDNNNNNNSNGNSNGRKDLEADNIINRDDQQTAMERYTITMFGLSLGPWLGDSVIRDRSLYSSNDNNNNSNSNGNGKKGFGSSKESSQRKQDQPKQDAAQTSLSSSMDGFAEWTIGVQKVAMQYKWDFGDTVRHVWESGRSMGVAACLTLPKSSMGTLNEKFMSKRIQPEEDRMLYIDYDMGAYAGFTLGSVYLKVPTFLFFSQMNAEKLVHPFVTQFAVFQKSGDGADPASLTSAITPNDKDNPSCEIICSKMMRVYDNNGQLKQGITSFLTLQQDTVPEAETTEP
eukprot:CAMPEP_0197840472 /NCGR_PEP_ID=MMETSP1437-20131217/45629_1 /TAXON_ID=49252 ORGANISM="Eucampia antarctica, Strain CCMP1452" /NCGR_SAMPLE_ID=MMETSP1437 /ASSEMBLY_ACC=CAM_ASM_001096 /LENGTH=644 /DNA_ID=CAMNT_0043450095 /DNA_START=30 /DNA_END=1965 /DNA_ORIENTATION=-